MNKRNKPTRKSAASTAKSRKDEIKREAAGAVAGAAAGAAVGAMVGPPGIAAGVAIGAAAGALAERALGRDADGRAAKEARLDADIGVSGGEIGAPNLRHPPARVGAYSAASVGEGEAGGKIPAEGPIPNADDE